MKLTLINLALFCFILLAIEQANATSQMYLNCQLDQNTKKIKGIAVLNWEPIAKGLLDVTNLNITSIKTNDGKKLAFKIEKGTLILPQRIYLGNKKIEIGFEANIQNSSKGTFQEFLGGNYWSNDFILLLKDWHPKIRGLASYRLTLKYPRKLTAISEADTILEKENDNHKTTTFIFDHARPCVNLIVGPFLQFKTTTNNVELIVYLLKDEKKLAQKLLNRLSFCLNFYERLISQYPFKRFQVIENRLPSGLALPTITLIGSQIIDKPFIEKTSLPHEFLHSWFGNSVYVDYKHGNWSEGLTTYLADYILEEKSGKGSKYRHQILSDYKSYVHPQNSFCLSKFQSRNNRVSKAIGYGKCAMIFHMLRTTLGDKTFFKAISNFSIKYRFKHASWMDIQKEFEKTAPNIKLANFFEQWLNRKDIPQITTNGAIYSKKENGLYELTLKINQIQEKPYELFCPVVVYSKTGKEKFFIILNKKEQDIKLHLNEVPLIVRLDPDFEIMRDLDKTEFPPNLSRLFGSEKKFLVLPDKKERKIYLPLISFLRKKGFEEIERKKLKHSFLKKADFIILGKVKGRLEQFAGKLSLPKKGFVIKIQKNPVNPTHVTAHVLSTSEMETVKVIYKLPHYGQYNYLRFESGELKEKKEPTYESGIPFNLQQGLSGISSQAIMDKYQIINALKFPKVVYLGEKHDEMGIHKAQFEIIKGLSKHNKVAVGMEMFQRPFQKVINEYLAGNIDEKTFLKETEYFKRWSFNYHFYRPIIEFCKKNGIPIVAINLQAEISKKIARSGLKGLSKKERQELPVELDLENITYRELLKEIYKNHKQEALKDFDNFFEAQIAWDETMALSISRFLESNPEYQMIVIVGGGHVEFGYGIPSRVKRRLKSISQAIVLFNQKEISPQKADFFLNTPKLKEPFLAKLGVLLGGDKKLLVEKVVPGSPASKAKIQPGDTIVAIDGNKVNNIYELKLELFFKEKGQTAEITVLRKDKGGKQKKIVLITGPFEPFDWTSKGSAFHMKK